MFGVTFEKEIGGYFIDPLIFVHKFVDKCDVCICSGECCYYGVYTDKIEHDKIIQSKDRISKSMDDSQTKDVTKWFEAPQDDDDFESGIAVGTELHNGKCVFLDKEGYCTLQKIAIEDGEVEFDRWKYKPLYCILFPLVIFERAITVDTDHLDRMHYCNKVENQNSTIFETCKNELKYLLGEKDFKQLEEYKLEYLEKLNAEKKSG
ncbi:MAG: DUF3109 family protein [Bacteroidetes bacterium]|nr:DUF3109 family protein [Bacteroidota bacterium]